MNTHVSRRDMLKLGAVSAACVMAGPALLRAAAPAKKIPIGVQLYSVRKQCAQDFPPVLKALAEMGYQGVEFAGYYGRKAEDLRKLLDDNGLKCCGTHTGLATLLGDAFKATVEFNKTLGNRFLVVPSLPHERTASVEALKETAKLFSELVAKAKEVDMRVGYHAHAGDLKPIDGQVPWDIIFSNASAELIMQLDTGNCMSGGGDPVAILKKYPGRTATIHIKEFGGPKGAVFGEGVVKWDQVLELCETTCATEWYIIEHESSDNPLDAVKRCLENLHKLGR